MKILLAVDGSKQSLDATRCVIDHADWYRTKPQVELLTVHRPVPQLPRMGLAVGKAQIQRYYQEEGAQVIDKAAKLLERAKVSYTPRMLVGDPAELIVQHAAKINADLICVGTPDHRIGSVANKVLQIADRPVLLVK